MLALPLIVPLCILIANYLFTGDMRDSGALFAGIIVASAFFTFPEYMVFMLMMWWWARGKPKASLVKASLLAPLVFVVVLSIGWLLRDPKWGAVVGATVLGLSFGYAYVVLAWLLTTLGYAMKWVRDDETAAKS